MKKNGLKNGLTLTLALVIAALALAPPAAAELCSIDAVPAATLLLPYFEVSLDNAKNPTTLFSINNASAAPALAHVTFWTDWSQPTFDFDVFLTGYDVVTVNLKDVFNGIVPITADAQNDPGDTISPHCLNPPWDGSFPGCAGVFPFGQAGTPVVGTSNLTRLVNGHTGQDVFGLGCMGETYPDPVPVARGYITIDNVSNCSTVFPNEVGYFQNGGLGIANNINQLWGDYFIVDETNNFSFGDVLVSIEADDTFNGGIPGYTFYGRYDPALTGSDNREPLGTTWASRYLNGGVFDGGTDLIVWRDSTTNDTAEFYGCGVGPSWRPLNETEVVAFDEEECAVEICFSQGGGNFSPPDPDFDPPCFPLETQRATFGVGDLSVPYDFGWVFLNLNFDDINVVADVDFGVNGDISQSYVTTVMSALGRFQVGFTAIELTDACQDVSPLVTDTGNIPDL